jgi:hypothetical protein
MQAIETNPAQLLVVVVVVVVVMMMIMTVNMIWLENTLCI